MCECKKAKPSVFKEIKKNACLVLTEHLLCTKDCVLIFSPLHMNNFINPGNSIVISIIHMRKREA